jgi:hypothetical protein
MFYESSLTIPKNTPRETPVIGTFPIHPGVVTFAEVFFPPGCAGLAHVQIWLWERQLWPSNPDSYFTGDGTSISFTEDLEVVDPPFELEIAGWNDDDTYPHTPIVRVQITPSDLVLRNAIARLGLGPTGPAILSEGL